MAWPCLALAPCAMACSASSSGGGVGSSADAAITTPGSIRRKGSGRPAATRQTRVATTLHASTLPTAGPC